MHHDDAPMSSVFTVRAAEARCKHAKCHSCFAGFSRRRCWLHGLQKPGSSHNSISPIASAACRRVPGLCCAPEPGCRTVSDLLGKHRAGCVRSGHECAAGKAGVHSRACMGSRRAWKQSHSRRPGCPPTIPKKGIRANLPPGGARVFQPHSSGSAHTHHR